jgi:hypothetical protein
MLCWTVKLYTVCKHDTHCTGGWVGPRVGLDRCEKSRLLLPPGRDRIEPFRRWNLPSYISASSNTVATNSLHVFLFLSGKCSCCSSYAQLNAAVVHHQHAVTANGVTSVKVWVTLITLRHKIKFDILWTVHRDRFALKGPTRCTFLNLFS